MNKRGYRRLKADLSLTFDGQRFGPRSNSERSRLREYIGEGQLVYCVQIPAGVLIAARAGDSDGHSVVLEAV